MDCDNICNSRVAMRTCQNCGRTHEGRLIETFIDGDGQPIEIIVCEQPRYNEKENV